jgi:hypothetical protein
MARTPPDQKMTRIGSNPEHSESATLGVRYLKGRLRDFYLYLGAVGGYWWAFMMGFPFIIDEAVKWCWPAGKNG